MEIAYAWLCKRRKDYHHNNDMWSLRSVNRGIKCGSPLSPLMGAIYLKPLDDAMKKMNLFYAGFMDDWVVMSKTRWKLKKAIMITNKTLNGLNVEKSPLKTYIGRIAYGFDFLGYRLTSNSANGDPDEIPTVWGEVPLAYLGFSHKTAKFLKRCEITCLTGFLQQKSILLLKGPIGKGLKGVKGNLAVLCEPPLYFLK